MNYRVATRSDAPLLAALNHELIRDERHRNQMSLAELEERMAGWLDGEYRAVLFEHEDTVIGYALYREEPEGVYLRQFFILQDYRRRGFGRSAMTWLTSYLWNHAERVRLDVLIGNADGIAFWHSIGFDDYCLTMERDLSRVL